MVTEREIQCNDDCYEILQVPPGADSEAIESAYKALARQYHPDNHETGDPEKFMQVVKAYKYLSDPEPEVALSDPGQALAILTEAEDADGYEGDERLFNQILMLLYVTRRKNLRRSGMGVFQLEEMLGSPSDDLEFHMWYLREKGYAERLENGLFSITADGVDRIIAQQKRLSRQKKRALKRS
jgi:hypothetical protein